MAWVMALQQLISNRVLARVKSSDDLLAFIAMPAGYAFAGPLASAMGADKLLAAAAGLMVLADRRGLRAAPASGALS